MASGRFYTDDPLSAIITQLWELDDNKCYPEKDYQLDLQGNVPNYTTIDNAGKKLFSWLNDRVLSRKTYKAFVALLDNFEMEVGKAEVTTRQETAEITAFIEAIMETRVMKTAHNFLVRKGKATAQEMEFKNKLREIWFDLYSRRFGSRPDSCSFEHVFVGESDGEKIIGLHNWIQFYLQERAGNLDYHGYIRKETGHDGRAMRLLDVQFDWNRTKVKRISSIFVGSSPELEIAIYTVCLLMGKEGRFNVKMGDYDVQITLYSHGHKDKMGTAYISAAK